MGPVPDDPGKSAGGSDINNVDTPQVIIPPSSSDSDEGDDNNSGYQLLPQDPDSITVANGDLSQDCGDTGTSAAAAPPAATTHHQAQESPQSPLDVALMQTLDQTGINSAAGGNSMFDLPPGEVSEDEVLQLWKCKREAEEMDQNDAQKIRQAMSGFVLPPSHQPDWAKQVPEEEWKARLFANLRSGETNSTPDTEPESVTHTDR